MGIDTLEDKLEVEDRHRIGRGEVIQEDWHRIS